MTRFHRPAPAALGLWLGFAALLPAAWAWAPRQSPAAPDSEATTFHVHGTVVDGSTGKPVPRVLVSSLDRRLATMTNSDGAFVLDVVTEGALAGGMQSGSSEFRLYLQLRKPGYLEPQTRVSIGLDSTSSTVAFKLMPGGVVEGHASANSAEPPSKVPVSLLMHSVVNGERIWTVVGSQRTNRDGGFRFTNLRPGEYAVMSNEWRGDQPLPPSRTAVTEQYPPVFFGDASSLSGAVRIHLHYGETAQTDLHLRSARYFPVTVPVGGVNQGINVRVSTGDAQSGYQLGYNQANHAVEGSLPSGTYTLLVTSYLPQQAYASLVLHVADAPVRTAEVVPVAPGPVIVRLHRDFTGKATPPQHLDARVYLQPEEQGLPFATAGMQPGQEDEMVLNDVSPGRYTVRVEPSYGYAGSVQSGGTDLKKEALVVGDGGAAAPIDVTLRDDSGQISGTVKTGDDPLPEMTFLSLLPLDSGGQFSTGNAGSDGRFTLGNVVPGSYRLFASRVPPWQMPWRDPEALHALDGKGVDVTVPSNASLTVDAPLLDDSAVELP